MNHFSKLVFLPHSIMTVKVHRECVRKTSFEKCCTTHSSACQMDFWSSTYDHRRSLDRSRGRSLDHPSLGRSIARSLGRSVARSLGRSVARSVGRSVVRSLGCSIARSLGRSNGYWRLASVYLLLSFWAVSGLVFWIGISYSNCSC